MSQGIDVIMEPLIKAMNSIPYIETFSCCEGHPEESAVKNYGYAVANVVFEIKDEPQYLISWLFLVQEILRGRKNVRKGFAFIFEKKYSLNIDNGLSWNWEVKIQATGETPEVCRKGLDEGIEYLTEKFLNDSKR